MAEKVFVSWKMPIMPTRFFDGRHWEDAQSRRIAETGQAPPPGAHGAKTLQAILAKASE